jgi:hypothetical protein
MSDDRNDDHVARMIEKHDDQRLRLKTARELLAADSPMPNTAQAIATIVIGEALADISLSMELQRQDKVNALLAGVSGVDVKDELRRIRICLERQKR